MSAIASSVSSVAASRKHPPFLHQALFSLFSAFLLNLCFPIAGPLPIWRSAFAWIALVPLLYTLLAGKYSAHPRYLHRSTLAGYLTGVIWYILNCYWIYATMHQYGNLPPLAAVGVLILFSLVLGLYFALFTFLIAYVRKKSRSIATPLLLAPFLWTAIELAASRITSVPWDQLGYSQVDNLWLTKLAPITGVYGISFVLAGGNALFAYGFLAPSKRRQLRSLSAAIIFAIALQLGSYASARTSPTQAIAVLLQDNLSVDENNQWEGVVWDENIVRFISESSQTCTPYLIGLPEPHPQLVRRVCPDGQFPATLIAWPEAPSPFREHDPRFVAAMHQLATTTKATIVAGNLSADPGTTPTGQPTLNEYNSGSIISPDGNFIGRYDKIHLVPFGEYIPYSNLLFFAHHLTQNVSDFSRGKERKVFSSGDGHRFGVFICYEAVFANEVRYFAKNGAEVLVNISDDAWYGDTSAPWQHLNMARMRAIENRRWILRDTNTGITAAIDPQGRVTQSVPRHIFTSLAANYNYIGEQTFYTEHGDIFGYLCVVITLAAIATAVSRKRTPHV